MATKLRPINETRRPDGTLTSETARRLLSRRGGLKTAALLRQDGFKQLVRARLISIIVRRSKALQRRSCGDCKALGESMSRQIAELMSQRHKPTERITREDAKLLS